MAKIPKIEDIAIGYQVFAREGDEEFGAVRGITPDRSGAPIYVENAGDFIVPLEAIRLDEKADRDRARARSGGAGALVSRFGNPRHGRASSRPAGKARDRGIVACYAAGSATQPAGMDRRPDVPAISETRH